MTDISSTSISAPNEPQSMLPASVPAASAESSISSARQQLSEQLERLMQQGLEAARGTPGSFQVEPPDTKQPPHSGAGIIVATLDPYAMLKYPTCVCSPHSTRGIVPVVRFALFVFNLNRGQTTKSEADSDSYDDESDETSCVLKSVSFVLVSSCVFVYAVHPKRAPRSSSSASSGSEPREQRARRERSTRISYRRYLAARRNVEQKQRLPKSTLITHLCISRPNNALNASKSFGHIAVALARSTLRILNFCPMRKRPISNLRDFLRL